MTDRELLELAAKAAGIKIEWLTASDRSPHIVGVSGNSHRCYFNPLGDDGDALRLAVRLHIDIRFEAPAIDPNWKAISKTRTNTYATESSKDAFAATRRAIVRAAAEIGGKL
jgi:hypothetical protein